MEPNKQQIEETAIYQLATQIFAYKMAMQRGTITAEKAAIESINEAKKFRKIYNGDT